MTRGNRIGINSTFAKKLDAGGWGLLFMWVGTAMLMNIDWNWALLGIGLIIIAVQLALLASGHKADIFMLALGALLTGSAVLDATSLDWTLFPLALLVLGGAIVLSAFGSALATRSR